VCGASDSSSGEKEKSRALCVLYKQNPMLMHRELKAEKRATCKFAAPYGCEQPAFYNVKISIIKHKCITCISKNDIFTR
jgi:hypothetical protein